MLLGIGNPDRGDDGAGGQVARRLDHPGWISVDCGTAPENFTGLVRRHQPDMLVLVDATHMGLPPGTVRRIRREQIEDLGLGTHMLPLHHLMDFLSDLVPAMVVIGIQPLGTDFGTPLSPPVAAAVREVAATLASGRLDTIPFIETRPEIELGGGDR